MNIYNIYCMYIVSFVSLKIVDEICFCLSIHLRQCIVCQKKKQEEEEDMVVALARSRYTHIRTSAAVRTECVP
jgi:hypothetical protein